jgi:hypothetical protein
MPDIIEQIEDEQAVHDYELMEKYEKFMEQWSATIKETIMVTYNYNNNYQKESARKTERNSALADIELWRSRSATLSTLY